MKTITVNLDMQKTIVESLDAMRIDIVRINGLSGLVAAWPILRIKEDIDRIVWAGIMSMTISDGPQGMVWGS